MTIQLNDDLIDFFSDIQIKFEWNNKFYIDFMNYFPLLKQGITTKDTYYNVIASYGLINNFIDVGYLIDHRRQDIIIKTDIISKIYNSYIKNSEKFKILRDNFSIYLLSKSYSIINNIIIVNYNISDELKTELALAKSLLDTIMSYSDENSSNCLFRLINMYHPKSTYNGLKIKSTMFLPQSSKIFDGALKTPSIRLLSSVLNDDTEDMVTAFYIDEIDYYIGYMDLYKLAISRKNMKIADILKEMIIIQNFYIKQALVNIFEDLIGPSDIPNIIYDIIK